MGSPCLSVSARSCGALFTASAGWFILGGAGGAGTQPHDLIPLGGGASTPACSEAAVQLLMFVSLEGSNKSDH